MRNGYYIHYKGRGPSGVSKKIDNQVKEFSKYYNMKEFDLFDPKTSLIRQCCGLIPGISIKRRYHEAIEKIKDPYFIYLRGTVMDKAYIVFLKTIKEMYPHCKVILEIQTYPYDKEYFQGIYWSYRFKEHYARPLVSKYVDRIVTFSNDKSIFDVPTIRTRNGIDVDAIHVVKHVDCGDVISIICVSSMCQAHGYERIIRGLWNFYKEDNENPNIIINMVGEGQQLDYYKKLVRKLHLESHVTFWGFQCGDVLESIYSKSDLSAASFGMYKNGLYISSALKVREYLSKGLPVITGCYEDAFEGAGSDFCMEFPNDSSDVDFGKIASFYHRIYDERDRNEVANRIHDFARTMVDMKVVMKPIVGYLNNEK